MFWPGELHGQRSLAGYSSQARKELDTTVVTWHARTPKGCEWLFCRQAWTWGVWTDIGAGMSSIMIKTMPLKGELQQWNHSTQNKYSKILFPKYYNHQAQWDRGKERRGKQTTCLFAMPSKSRGFSGIPQYQANTGQEALLQAAAQSLSLFTSEHCGPVQSRHCEAILNMPH